jgi:cytidylate kinase
VEKERTAIIAIDGPAATGKTTSAAGVAQALGIPYVDSGALYRAVALVALEEGIRSAGDPRLADVLRRHRWEAVADAAGFRVLVDGADVTGRLREPEVSRLASVLATDSRVRAQVVAILRTLAQRGAMVVEGRDIGTVVFPDAVLKVFMTAEPEERARRRWRELRAKGSRVSLEEVLAEIRERDARDAGRDVAPLKPAPDAVLLDTTHLSIPEQIRRIVELYRERTGA